MEEEIEIIQNIIFNKNGDQMNYIDINNGTPDNECETFITAIEHLIKGYKQLEEENKQLEAIKDEAIRRYNFESIPKSLVKEKIEELKQKAISYGTFIDKDESFNIQSKISVLQDLLGE